MDHTSDTEPQFETECHYIDGTVGQFQSWIGGESSERCGAFGGFDRAEFWAYADYKYLAVLFKDRPEILQDVLWEDFGFPGRGGRESTLWVGSRGANTPCHIDSYGCNLVLQVEGRKKWHLFPPEDSDHLYPTRIPYEESSIFSRVHVVNPNRSRYPSFCNAHPHVVTLHPGQVLFVPRHWWHYVESVDDVTVSVNSWIELDSDDEARVEEAITRIVVCAFKSADPSVHPNDWLNPTEGAATSHGTNLDYLNRACTAYLERKRATGDGDAPPLKKRRADGSSELIGSRFGQYLLPVLPASGEEDARGKAETQGKEDVRGKVETQGKEDARGKAETRGKEDTRGKAKTQGKEDARGKAETRGKEDETGKAETQGKEDAREASPGADAITSDVVLDCLVNPRVVRLVAQLLLTRPSR
ncbi:HSPB1-associated protein 1 isoform X2 [Aquarana catesbeiana]|uniref:HSPB1-associated protein 1 isoform X2 n=1 Tax=Aquarana catesbeiana TaxID=8400 RepID=UPI003CC992A1